MPDTIRHMAFLSIARGSGFALLAIVCLMLAFSYDGGMALRVGGFAMLLASAVLMLKAHNAPARPYRRTEVWMMLEEPQRPAGDTAQNLIADSLIEASLTCARWFAGGAALCLILAELVLLSR